MPIISDEMDELCAQYDEAIRQGALLIREANRYRGALNVAIAMSLEYSARDGGYMQIARELREALRAPQERNQK